MIINVYLHQKLGGCTVIFNWINGNTPLCQLIVFKRLNLSIFSLFGGMFWKMADEAMLRKWKCFTCNMIVNVSLVFIWITEYWESFGVESMWDCVFTDPVVTLNFLELQSRIRPGLQQSLWNKIDYALYYTVYSISYSIPYTITYTV